MTTIQLGSGSSSLSSHRGTRASSTLNRRYVERPSNLAIEETAQMARKDTPVSSRPSRLVNLRVHAADLANLPPEEPENNVAVPRVVEMGYRDEQLARMSAENSASMSLMPVADQERTVMAYGYENTELTMQEPAQPPVEIDTDALAMNIAADYAATNLGISAQKQAEEQTQAPRDELEAAMASARGQNAENSSIDAIAHAASEAIAAIRTATDPEEVAEQVTSLKDFAESIKASSDAPEIIELSDTIEKFVNIAMRSSRVQEEVERKEALEKARAKAKAKADAEAKAAALKVNMKKTTRKASSGGSGIAIKKSAPAPTRKKVSTGLPRPTLKRAAKKTAPKLASGEEQALRKALNSVVAMDSSAKEKPARNHVVMNRKVGAKRFALAFFCAAVCVSAVVYFVSSNIPDISVRVAALQTGIDASCPAYIPREYSLSDISSEEGKIVLTFKGEGNASFTLSEEKSSWDSTTLLRNFVTPTWNNNYTTTHEQGITIYMSGSNAAWVNGGILFKIETSSGSALTKKQLRNIVTSL